MDHANEDILLWESFRNGDRDAFASLFRRHYESLYLYGRKFADNSDLLEDAIQELFVELWQSRSRIPVTSVRAYLLKSLKYKILRTSRRRYSILPLSDESGLFEWSHEDQIITLELNAENSRKVIEALDRLSTRQKEIVYLKYYQGLSYEEISEIMNINYQVARNLLYQAIKSLKSLISLSIVFYFLIYH